ncbi:MAG: glycoside hydrolase family 3 N-terminal domain-containing protein, partial [Bacteroidota bacterium]
MGLLALLPVLAFTLPKNDKPTLNEAFASADALLANAAQHARRASDSLKTGEGEDENPGKWAKATLDSMSLDEKIGQLFMIAAYSNKDEKHNSYIQKLVTEDKIGGLIFMQGGPGRQIALLNRYQSVAKVPLLISQDAEWGLGMRLDSTVSFPKNMTLGAIRDSLAIFELGMEVGRQCRR